MTTRAGPLLETLLRRLIETPGEFLREPHVETKGKQHGEVHVAALVGDTLRALQAPRLSLDAARPLLSANTPAQMNALRLTAVTCWLLHEPWFRDRPGLASHSRALLLGGLKDLAEVVKAEDCVTDPDRREELARLVLLHLDLHPEGETATAARDRLTSLDSAERLRVTRAAMEAERRAREVREKATRAAAEAASYYGRE